MREPAFPNSVPRVPGPRAFVGRAWGFSRPLTVVCGLMLLTLAVSIAGVALDPRVITGAPAWLKPAKFAISITIYCATLLWLLTFVEGRPRLVALIGWSTAVALGAEMVIIVGTALLGTTSHFNVSTPLHGVMWSIMFLGVVATQLANLIAIALLLFQRLPDPAFAWALRLGLIVSFVGMGVAFLMPGPTPDQLASAGEGMPTVGAHSVGVEDGGPGLPIVGWSTEGGDLRIPHFFGLHGLQILPVFGFLVAGLGAGWLRPGHRVALVWTVGLAYLGLIALLTWQALRGQPVVAPDAPTLGALLALALVSAGAVFAVVIHARRTRGA